MGTQALDPSKAIERVESDGSLRPRPAVIDKDAASCLLATELEANVLVFSTDVDKVSLNLGTPEQTDIDRMTAAECRRYLDDGHFATGSMRPKIEAALADNYSAVRDLFIEREGNVGKASLINAAVDDLTDSVDGIFKIGTDSLNRRIENTDDTIVRYERSIENYRTTLERKFMAMESTVSLLQAQGNYLSDDVMGVGATVGKCRCTPRILD